MKVLRESQMQLSQPTSLRLLDVRLAEGLHKAAVAGKFKNVAAVLTTVEEATLPGLLEYLCLRHTRGQDLQLPPLPDRIVKSPLGRSLQQVVCPFGLRTSGAFSPSSSVNPFGSEFFALRNSADYLAQEYKLFETRWARACERLGFRERSSALLLALTAMVENAILHANSPAGVLVGYQQTQNAAAFTVADVGIGVLASLRSNCDFIHLRHHRDALRLALQDGVSCLGVGNGFGFHQLFKALANQYGTIRLRTGDVCVTMDGQDFDADIGQETFPEAIQGMVVTVCCRKDSSAPGESRI
ncbi:MAG: hypothetical protein U0744_08765 [Gemmataceae bacterium]